jgi:hypothetical protein
MVENVGKFLGDVSDLCLVLFISSFSQDFAWPVGWQPKASISNSAIKSPLSLLVLNLRLNKISRSLLGLTGSVGFNAIA